MSSYEEIPQFCWTPGVWRSSDWVPAASQWQPAKSTGEKRITWVGWGPIKADQSRTLVQWSAGSAGPAAAAMQIASDSIRLRRAAVYFSLRATPRLRAAGRFDQSWS